MSKAIFLSLVALCWCPVTVWAAPVIVNGDFAVGTGGWSRSAIAAPYGYTVQTSAAFPGGTQYGLVDNTGTTNPSRSAAETELYLTANSLDLIPSVPTGGGYIFQDVLFAAGESVSFDGRFFTNEDGAVSDFNDFAFASIALVGGGGFQQVSLLASVNSSALIANTFNGYARTGNGVVSGNFVVPTAGVYRLAFGVFDGGASFNQTVDSAIAIDNVLGLNATTGAPELDSKGSLLGLSFAFVGLLALREKRRKAIQ
jgi:hypothetical protein